MHEKRVNKGSGRKKKGGKGVSPSGDTSIEKKKERADVPSRMGEKKKVEAPSRWMTGDSKGKKLSSDNEEGPPFLFPLQWKESKKNEENGGS